MGAVAVSTRSCIHSSFNESFPVYAFLINFFCFFMAFRTEAREVHPGRCTCEISVHDVYGHYAAVDIDVSTMAVSARYIFIIMYA